MSAAAPSVLAAPPVTHADRLAATVVLAILVHALFVFGVGFRERPLDEPRFDTLEVVLVTRSDDQAPEDADLAAQVNAEGGGKAEQSERPAAPLEAPFPDNEARIARPAEQIAPPAPPIPAPPRPDTRTTAPAPAPAPSAERRVLTGEANPEGPAPLPERTTPSAEPPQSQPQDADRARPSASELIASSMEMASLNAELEQRLDALAKRPRRKYISASTREYKYAAYLESWRAKVERVGNLNYPDAAREAGLSGSLLLDVALNQDGSVREITVRRSSGHRVLDEAAVRIVELAAPYAPLPPAIRKEVDILHITRTWQFLNNAGFSAN